MSLELSRHTEEQLIAQARAGGLSVDEYVRYLLTYSIDQEHAIEEAVAAGERDIAEGRVYPAREALAALGKKLSVSR